MICKGQNSKSPHEDDFTILFTKMEKENEVENRPKKRLRLSTLQKDRFAYIEEEEIASICKEIASICKGYVPPNTQKNTNWALKCFTEWSFSRNKKSSDICPEDLLDVQCPKALDKWISTFVAEARRFDGE